MTNSPKKSSDNLTKFFFMGFLSGFLILVFSAIFWKLLISKNLVSITSIVLLEEFFRLTFLWLSLKDVPREALIKSKSFLAFLLFGIGFSLIETLILLNQSVRLNILSEKILQPAIIHIINSIIAGLGITFFIKNKKPAWLIFTTLLVILIHLIYNIIQAKIILQIF